MRTRASIDGDPTRLVGTNLARGTEFQKAVVRLDGGDHIGDLVGTRPRLGDVRHVLLD
jgi:hypothetical protein